MPSHVLSGEIECDVQAIEIEFSAKCNWIQIPFETWTNYSIFHKIVFIRNAFTFALMFFHLFIVDMVLEIIFEIAIKGLRHMHYTLFSSLHTAKVIKKNNKRQVLMLSMPMHTKRNKNMYDEYMSLAKANIQSITSRGIVSTISTKTTIVIWPWWMKLIYIHRSFVAYFFLLTIHFQFRLMFQIDDINETYYFHIVIGEDENVFV